MRLISTILYGGAGSRHWPVSRELHPKPFIRLGDGQRPLQKALLRGAQLPGVAAVLTVTDRELFFKTEDEFRDVNAAGVEKSFVLEPLGRSIARNDPAIGIQWPIEDEPALSAKDQQAKPLARAEHFA